MDDSFSFGHPQKHRSRTRPRRTKRARARSAAEACGAPAHHGSNDGRRVAFGVIGVVLAAASVWGYLHLEGAKPAGGRGSTGQIDAGDLQAKQAAAVGGADRSLPLRSARLVRHDHVARIALRGLIDRLHRDRVLRRRHRECRIDLDGRRARRPVPVGNVFLRPRHRDRCTYVTGSTCTGHAAQGASAPAWPSQST